MYKLQEDLVSENPHRVGDNSLISLSEEIDTISKINETTQNVRHPGNYPAEL